MNRGEAAPSTNLSGRREGTTTEGNRPEARFQPMLPRLKAQDFERMCPARLLKAKSFVDALMCEQQLEKLRTHFATPLNITLNREVRRYLER